MYEVTKINKENETRSYRQYLYKNINNHKKYIKRKRETKLKEKKECSIRKWKSGAKKDADLDTAFLIFVYLI